LGLLLAAAAIFDGAVFYFRWNSTREAEHAKTAKEAEDAQKFLKIAGGNELKILAFYASPDILRRGEHTLLCYGVNDAKTVRLEPSVEEVWPSFTRCIQVSPRKQTDCRGRRRALGFSERYDSGGALKHRLRRSGARGITRGGIAGMSRE